MARYRGILRAAVALVLLLPAAWRADAQDMLVIDSGGARWKSGESRKPSVIVDFGVIDTLSADRRRSAFGRQDRRSRRYLTLSVPQPEPVALPERYDPPVAPVVEAPPEAQPPVLPDSTELAAVPAAELQPGVQAPPPPERHDPPVAPVVEALPEAQPPVLPDSTELAAVPPAELQPGVQAPPPERHDPPVAPVVEAPPEAQPPVLPDSTELAAAPAAELQPEASARPSVPALSKPAASAPAAALPARRSPAGETEATPALQAFLSRANGTNNAAHSAKPVRAKLPPPRPIQPRRTESSDAASAGLEMRFRLPPPAPATGRPGAAAPSPAAAGDLPPPAPATGTPETGRLPPPVRPEAGAPKPRRLAALDTSALPVAAAPVVTGHSVTFLYKAGGTALDATDRARLGRLAAKLARETELGVEIRAYAGSAESAGVETRREALSRAMEVRRLLIAAGVPEARIVARAAGTGEEAGARVDVVLVGRS